MKRLTLTLLCITGIISMMNAQDTFVVLDEQTNYPVAGVSISLLNNNVTQKSGISQTRTTD